MHGGPGAGSYGSSARFFNPQRYRVVLFDQRGCGKSTPNASDDDATPALTDNTTQHLIDPSKPEEALWHCQLKRPWYAGRVGGAAARVGELLYSPIVLPAQAERGQKKAPSVRLVDNAGKIGRPEANPM